MKNVKLFEEFLNEEHALTKEQEDFLNSVVQGTWEINSQGLIDVNGTVSILEKTIKKFPVKFGTVSGDFICMDCPSLTSLKGAPQKVDRSFYCLRCVSLVSLEGTPEKVRVDFSCSGCTSLRTLEGAPHEVGEDFYCNRCPSVPQEELEIVKNKVLREAWLKSGLSFEEFKKQKKGLIAAKNFGF